FAIQQLQLGIAVALPELFLSLQMAQLPGSEGGKHAAVLEVAVDAVPFDALADDARALESHQPELLRLFWRYTALYHVNIAAVAVDDLSAVASGCTESDPGGFQHHHPHAVFQQKQRAGQAG